MPTMPQNDPPIRTTLWGEDQLQGNLVTPAWARYFLALQQWIQYLAANIGGGGSVLPDQYRVDDPATVASNGRLDPLDYTAYNGITVSLLVDRAMSLTDPVFVGGPADRKGKRLTLQMVFTSGGTMQMFGVNLQLQPMGDLTVNTGALLTQRATAEWRFDEVGFGHPSFVWESA